MIYQHNLSRCLAPFEKNNMAVHIYG